MIDSKLENQKLSTELKNTYLFIDVPIRDQISFYFFLEIKSAKKKKFHSKQFYHFFIQFL